MACLTAGGCARACGASGDEPTLEAHLRVAWPEAHRWVETAESPDPWAVEALEVAGIPVGRVASRTREGEGFMVHETHVERWLTVEGQRWPWVDHRLTVYATESGERLALRRLQQGTGQGAWSVRGRPGAWESSEWQQGVWRRCMREELGDAEEVHRLTCGSSQVTWSERWAPGWPEARTRLEQALHPPTPFEDAPWVPLAAVRDALRVPFRQPPGLDVVRAPRVLWRLEADPDAGLDWALLCGEAPDRQVLASDPQGCTLRQLASASHAVLRWGESLPEDAPEVGPVSGVGSVQHWAYETLGREGETVRSGVQRAVTELSTWADPAVVVDRMHPAEVLHSRRGSCLALSHLLVDALRSRGIPARVEVGLVPDDEGSLVHHAWVAWWDGRWVSADPAHGRLPASPASLRLATWPSPIPVEDLSRVSFTLLAD